MKKIPIFLAALFVAQISFAAPIMDVTPNVKVEKKVPRNPPEPIVQDTPPATGNSALNNAFFLFQLQNTLKDAKNNYLNLDSTIVNTQKKLDSAQESVSTLKEQISLFQEQIQQSENKILNVRQQIALKEQDIAKLTEEVDARKMALSDQKKLLQDYMRAQYVQENTFFEGGQLSTAKVLLADQTVGDTYQTVQTMDMFQQAGGKLLNDLATSTQTLEGMQLSLEGKKSRLDALKASLENEQSSIRDEKFAKDQLLKDTHGNEQIYKNLIAEALKQEQESLLEIRALQDNMHFIQQKLKDSGSDIDISGLQNLIGQRSQDFYNYQLQTDSNAEFQWPVAPNRGISAYFRDANYVARFGVNHNAVDIPTPQGTPVRAAKDGYVYKVKDNGMGYSYIILSHKDGFNTTYGHVSQFLVKENDFVKAGDVIALSGGTPGTKGAGPMTTGAHLHFEILKDGKYVDPLEYLSLAPLNLENLPAKYADRIAEFKRSEPVLPDGLNTPLDQENLGKYIDDQMAKEAQQDGASGTMDSP